MSEDESLDYLRSILTNESGDVPLAPRFRALFTLKNLGAEGNEDAIHVIAQGFRDDSELLKHELAYVLGQTKSLKAAPILRAVLEDAQQQPMVRHEAAEALGALNDAESLELLEKYLKDDPLEVIRQTCELAIERIKWAHSEASQKEDIAESIFTSIDPAPPLPSEEDKVESLKSQLNDQSLSLFHRYRAMFRLRDIGTPDAVLALASGFSDPSALFRHEIAYVFGQMSDPVSVPALVQVLQNSSEEGMVRHEAAEALGSIATDDVLPVLHSFVKDNERVVRESAVVALDMYEYERSTEMDLLANPTVV